MESNINKSETPSDDLDTRFGKKKNRLPTRVLLAEDDDEMHRLLYEAFVYDGYDVLDVGSGLELFDSLRRSRKQGRYSSIVVSDIRMPGMSGLDVLKRIRESGSTTPVILITAFEDEETVNAASQLGATALFSKPFDIDDLRTAVYNFVAGDLSPAK